jgi:hypothetical protein
MTDSKKTIDAKKAGTVNSIVAGVAGVVAGGMAVAAAVVMSDKKNQKKVSDVLVGAKEKVTEFVNAIKSQPVVEKIVAKVESKV